MSALELARDTASQALELDAINHAWGHSYRYLDDQTVSFLKEVVGKSGDHPSERVMKLVESVVKSCRDELCLRKRRLTVDAEVYRSLISAILWLMD